MLTSLRLKRRRTRAGSSSPKKRFRGPIAWVAGRLLRWRFLRYAKRTTASVLGFFTSNNRRAHRPMRRLWPPPGRSSFGIHAIIARHYFGGAAYPVGGASPIAAGIAPYIERSGGRIVVSAEVARILTGLDRRAAGSRWPRVPPQNRFEYVRTSPRPSSCCRPQFARTIAEYSAVHKPPFPLCGFKAS